MEYAIETNGLSKSYGSVRAVDSVNLHVGHGEIYGFLGLNGAGKTTTIRALLGMIRPSAGSVRVLGWGDWFPWAVPGLMSSLSGMSAGPIALHSYMVVLLAFAAGVAATFAWWRSADQAR